MLITTLVESAWKSNKKETAKTGFRLMLNRRDKTA